MSETYSINNMRARRNGFIGHGLKRSRLNEEQKATSGNQFIASLIMKTKHNFFKNEVYNTPLSLFLGKGG
jgi:hypothetical protein